MFSARLLNAARLTRRAHDHIVRRTGRTPVRQQLLMEALEDRTVPAVFEVTTVADAGPGSLRQAVLDSNASPGPDAIAFDVGGGGGQTIFPTSALPEVTDPVTIDGTTQPGYAGSPLIVLNGSRAGVGANGLTVSAGGSTIRGLVINSFFYANGVVLQGDGGNRVVGNYIGTDVTGTTAVDTHNGMNGVAVFGGSGNVIGGTTPADRNLVSGNGMRGVFVLSADGTVVQGNYIGTDVTGTRALGNGFTAGGAGVTVSFSPNTTIGGTAAGAGNLISGHLGSGVGIGGSSGSRVQGNYIGTDVTGTRALGNAAGVGVGSSVGCIVGGTEPGARNVISGNTQVGVSVGQDNNRVEGNYIGTDVTGTRALGNGVGVQVTGLGNLVAGNLVSGNTVYGVSVSGRSRVQGNFIGTDVTGTSGLPNGVGVRAAGFGAVVGGTAAGAGNLISGNATHGVELAGQNAVVQGNAIGTDVSGTRPLGNGTGVFITPFDPGVRSNVVGGAEPGAGNLISGNRGDGIAGRAEAARVEGNLIGTDAAGAAAVPNGGNGIAFSYVEATAIGGNVISGNALSGIALGSASSFVAIRGNLIGTNAAGTASLANGGHGIHVDSPIGHVTNVIGGTDAGSRNVISGNALDGVRLEGAAAGDFRVLGNYIGTNAAGTLTLPNGGSGVVVSGGTGLQIGGSAPGAGNLISGNSGDGVVLASPGNLVSGNRIGTNAAGTAALGNVWGVRVTGGANRIGGTEPGAGNLVSGNRFGGIDVASGGNVVQGNFIGTDATGTLSVRNQINAGVLVRFGASGNTIGGTEPGAGNLISGNTNALAGVQIEGSNNVVQGNLIGTDVTGTLRLGNSANGVRITGGSNNLVGGTTPGARNVISGNAREGVFISAGGNRVQGNLIGTDVTGTRPLGNAGDGVFIIGRSDNLIGGTEPGAGNVIADNADGVDLAAGGNTVQGNLIGTDVTGAVPMGNRVNGVAVNGGFNTVGGTAPGARNVIAASRQYGVVLQGFFNRVEGNYVGTDATGSSALPNLFDGLIVTGSSNTIGGAAAGAGNLISGNAGSGIQLSPPGTNNSIQGNRIGTDAAGTAPLPNGGDGVDVFGAASGNTIGGTAAGEGNTIAFNGRNGVTVRFMNASRVRIRGNAIHSNALLGIDLGGNGVTPNDPGDADSGANQFQNFPVLSVALAGAATRVIGSLNSTANTTFTLDFYASAAADPSGFGEGERYLGSAVVTTDGSGNARFEVTVAGTTAPGEVVTATATDPAGNTSEFSLAEVAAREAAIDVKPGDTPNEIDLNSNGVIPVAVLTTPDFDAATVDTSDLSRIRFGDADGSDRVSAVRSALEDVDGDGDLDLVLFFSARSAREAGALTASTTRVEVTGLTTEGLPFWGADGVQVLPGD